MKKLVLLASVFIGLSTQAQPYFQETYTTGADAHYLNLGENTRIIGAGHLMSGTYRTSGTAAVSNPMVVKTDVNGAIANPTDFANIYNLFIANSAAQLTVNTCHAREINPAVNPTGISQYTIVGEGYEVNAAGVARSYLYITELDNAGNLVPLSGSLFFVQDAAGNYYGLRFLNSRIAINGRSEYVCGAASEPTTGNTYGFVMKLNLGTSPATIMWSNVFNINRNSSFASTMAFDVMESPYNALELIVVGASADVNGTDGFVQKMNRNTGLFIGNSEIFGTAATYETFNAIDNMFNPGVIGANGFVIGGNSNGTGNMNQYLCFINQALNISANVELPYIAGDFHTLTDVRERRSPVTGFQYLTTGRYIYLNNSDVLTQRYFPATGVLDTYLYGTTDTEEGNALDFYDLGTPNTGLSSYGNAWGALAMGTPDFYHVKSYFSGESGCNELITTGTPVAGPGPLGTYTPKQINKFQPASMKYSYHSSAFEVQHCWANSLPGGSNNMTGQAPSNNAPADKATVSTSGLSIEMATPAEAGGPINVVISATASEPKADVRIYDMLGRSFEVGSYPLNAGQNALQLNTSGLNLNRGIYLMEVSAGTRKETKMIYIQ